jgi:integrase/recombinase XerD
MSDIARSAVDTGVVLPYSDAFLDSLVAHQGLSRHTWQAYQRDLVAWREFMVHQGIYTVQEVTPQHHGMYIQWLEARGLGSRSIARYLTSLGQYMNFLISQGVLARHPWQGLRAPKYTQPLPRILTTTCLQRLLTYGHQENSPQAKRAGLLLELLYATGLRASELVSLPVLRLTPGHIPSFTVQGKGGHERFVFLTPSAVHALERYMPVRLTFAPTGKSAYLFPSYGHQGYITRQRLGQILKEAALSCAMDPTAISPHTLRHAFASHLLHRGVDLVTLKQLLGHQDIGTTQIYTHVQPEKWMNILIQHHPLAELAM